MAPASTIPPALPPSVEEAYRRKCIQLKQRTAEVEESNDASRMRLQRLKRQVEKMRLERAFLLEQLAKRTSTNVEDSEGSPSPPPTPKDKPLRIKRGHRKPSMLNSLDTPPSIGAGSGSAPALLTQGQSLHGGNTQSPSSDAFSSAQNQLDAKGNGYFRPPLGKAPPKKPDTAYELYCNEAREELREKLLSKQDKDDEREGDDDDNAAATNSRSNRNTRDVEEELERTWKDMPESQRNEFQARAEKEQARYQSEKEAYDEEAATAAAEADSKGKASRSGASDAGGTSSKDAEAADDAEAEVQASRSAAGGSKSGTKRSRDDDDDVEMANYDTDQETQGEKSEES